MPAASAAGRLKREDCPRTKHDSVFSPWKVLVGPSDWEDHSAGKEGIQRYRIRNLPDNFPGLYELGVAGSSDDGVRARRRDSRGVVVVYLGQADNVRARLQQYGRSGSHLDTGNPLSSAGKAEVNSLAAGPGLFREVFSRGYSVVFRCALMDNKQEAAETETQLLRVFDYAWNKLQNGACRREEVLVKLEKGAVNHRSSVLGRVRHMKQRIFGQKAGIKIKGSSSVDTSSGIMRRMLPRVRTFVGFRPQLVKSDDDEGKALNTQWENTSEDNTCANRPAHRRSEGYKVKKINVAKRRTMPLQDSNYVCGVTLEDGSSCLEDPVQGRKRCCFHKGRRVKGSPEASSFSYPCKVEIPSAEFIPRPSEDLNNTDQAQETEILPKNMSTTVRTGETPSGNGAHETSRDAGIYEEKDPHAESESQEQQPSGRMWFELLKAQTKSASTHSYIGSGCQTRVADDVAPINRAMTDSGSCQMVPKASIFRSSGWPCTCGARTSDGSPCKNQPVEGRKRCAWHKGQRA